MVGIDVQILILVEDLSMNGSNGPPLVVEHPKVLLGPLEETLNYTFYIYTLVLHWHAFPTTNDSV